MLRPVRLHMLQSLLFHCVAIGARFRSFSSTPVPVNLAAQCVAIGREGTFEVSPRELHAAP